MYILFLLLLLFLSNESRMIFGMEESDEDLSTDLQEIMQDKKKLRPSKYAFDKAEQNSSSWYTNMELRCKASTINRSQQYLQFLEFEFKTEPTNYKDKLTQFNLLKEIYSNYLLASTWNNVSGDCLDPSKKEELKIRIQDRGSVGYFERALAFKVEAENEYTSMIQEEKKTEEIKIQEKMKRILKTAESAKMDFIEAHKLDNNNEESLKLVEEVDQFIKKIEEEIYDSKDYLLALNKTKEAYAFTRQAYRKILLARSFYDSLDAQDTTEEKEPITRQSRNKTLEALKRLMIIKPKEEQRQSLQDHEFKKNLEEDYSIKKKYIVELDRAENLCLKAIARYFEAFKLYKEKLLLDKIQGLLELVNELEMDRNTMTPHGIVIRHEISQFHEQLQENLELLKEKN